MLAIEVLVDEILRLQNLTMYLQVQLQEARKMQETNWFVAHPEVVRYILQHEQNAENTQELIGSECDIADELAVIVIQCDEIIHTDGHPFCSDMTCGCHRDRTLIREHLMEPERAGLLTWFEARALWRGVTL